MEKQRDVELKVQEDRQAQKLMEFPPFSNLVSTHLALYDYRKALTG